MDGDIKNQINQLLDDEKWLEARELIQQALEDEPDNHWLMTNFSSTYYENKEYKKAVEVSEKALLLAPDCPLVLWDYACATDMTGRFADAIAIWEKLIEADTNELAHGECGEGLRWTESLQNDCIYRLAVSYKKLGKIDMAKNYLKEHISNRKPGLPSVYTMKEVKKQLNQLAE
ncbi:tetratricopeptide repeat protein [bacterium]|nr:tetratricopeptide repeat protein [bacterium]